ncbi:MAG: hypothetical protein V1874_11295 [Spirochaetota bacterium]
MFENNLKIRNTGTVTVKKVTTKSMLKEFIMLPWSAGLYENDPAWVPPIIKEQKKFLDPKKGYFFEIGEAVYFLAYKNGKPSGRISAHINRLYEEKYDKETGFFGFFESINDIDVARALFTAAEDWLLSRGKSKINGPQNFSIYDQIGFEVHGENVLPVTGLGHYAPYYKDFVSACGFIKCADWHCVLVKDIEDYKPFLDRVRNSLMEKIDVTFTTLKKSEIKTRAQDIKTIFNKAWESNWGHLPLTDRQFDELFKELSMIIIPELTIFAEKDGETVGFIVSIPDTSPAMKYLNGRMYPWQLPKVLKMIKSTNRLRTIIMGVLPEHRRKMIDTVFYLKTIETGTTMGYESSDCCMVVETNTRLLNALKRLKCEIYKTYRLYEKKIG